MIRSDKCPSMTNRDGIRSQYNDAANEFQKNCEEGVKQIDSEFIQPWLDTITIDLAALKSEEMQHSVQHTKLALLREDCSRLISKIHQYIIEG